MVTIQGIFSSQQHIDRRIDMHQTQTQTQTVWEFGSLGLGLGYELGQRHFAPGHSEHPVSDRVFGMTFYPGQLSLRTPCLFFLMPGDRNEHLLLEIVMKRRCEMSLSRPVQTRQSLG